MADASAARLRISLSAAHTVDDIDRLMQALRGLEPLLATIDSSQR